VSLVATDAVVLHVMPYMESSRILRLATRELGVVSVLGRGARKSQRRFGSALDLFAEGQAQFSTRPGRDLHTLTGFDVTRARIAIGQDLDRFTAAAAVAELVLQLAQGEVQPTWYDALVTVLDALATAPPGRAREAGLAGIWRLVAAFGVQPSLDACVSCHAEVARAQSARFSHPSGGVVCATCARLVRASRTLPADARDVLRVWLESDAAVADLPTLDEPSVRAHQRLLREWLREHLTEGKPLRAYEAWEGTRWNAGEPAAGGDAA
jgi:DNA repair protein RecO (recombination protein O)